jgi:hypothetical protein
MSKSTHFFGQSVFGQLISLIDDDIISDSAKMKCSDYYIKKFKTRDHLVSMLFCAFAKCTSLREVSGAMLGLAGKTKHFKLNHIPYRSTLSDANKRRDADVFSMIYHKLLKKYSYVLSDTRLKEEIKKQIEIFDSTTISLFQDILRCVGRNPASGKRKGGIKVHSIINVDEKVPKMIWITDAATHDHQLLKKLEFKTDTIYVFDKGYTDYKAFDDFTSAGVGFVTRNRENAIYAIKEQHFHKDNAQSGVIDDATIEVTVKRDKSFTKLKLRRINYYDKKLDRHFEFLTNLFDLKADQVASIYKLRWQIELLFKQLKQNFPLKYFLGDNENALKIQIYCALIANLLMTVIMKALKRAWAFSNLVSFCKIHLFNYIHLISFLENPDKDWRKNESTNTQLNLFEGLTFEFT